VSAVSKIRDLEEVLLWLKEGRSYQWIVDEYERKYGITTTTSMWCRVRGRHGLARRIVRDENLTPWKVEPEHRHSHAISMLRAEARVRRGLPLLPKVSESLANWLDRLGRDDRVVHYDRTVGWRYVPRRQGVDLDLIREPVDPRLNGAGHVSSQIVLVYKDGREVPFDPLLLAGSDNSHVKALAP